MNVYSIRGSLQGPLADFQRDSGFVDCSRTEALVLELTSLLASYREEDEPLFPSVFVMASLDTLGEVASGSKRVRIGQFQRPSASVVLKDCAPLAQGGWAIYVAKTEDNQFEYGVFRSLTSSIGTSAEEALTVTPAPGAPSSCVLLIRNRGHLVVEVQNAAGKTFVASLTANPPEPSQFAGHVALLSRNIAADIAATQPHFLPYLTRFLLESLQRCHGTLCAVVRSPETNPARGFEKSVWLEEPLDWAEAHQAAMGGGGADLAVLQSIERLVVGMINSDGVVVFSSGGRVVGYRAFLSPTASDTQVLADGGGRKRTYALMTSRLNQQLVAAFYRSQDGASACQETQ